MAKPNRNTVADTSAIPIRTEPENPGLDDPGFALSEPHVWFDAEALGEHHDWLRITGNNLNRAMDAITCIGVLASMVRASKQGKELCRPYLTNPQEHALIDAIALIADGVNEGIAEASTHLHAKLQEGGAA